jgi:hypothetical protein
MSKFHRLDLIALTGLAVVVLASAGAGVPVVPSAQAACMAGDKIDGTTANDARKKIEGAGYSMVRDLKKGCDNVWHAEAMRGSEAVHVAMLPQGQITPEGD